MLFTQSSNCFEDNFKKSSEILLYFSNNPYFCTVFRTHRSSTSEAAKPIACPHFVPKYLKNGVPQI